MYSARFEYTAPSTLEVVIATLSERRDEAKVLAGGQSLIPLMKLRFATPGVIVDLNGVPGLDYIEEREGELRIGALPQPEIAVAVLAELVAWRHARTCSPAELLESIDPVCGMTVAVGPDTPQAEYEGTTYWFCCLGCRSRFAKDPAVFLAST